MDLRAESINWNCPAGKQLELLAIIRPALERSRHDYEAGDPSLKTRLANLRPSGKDTK
jgi:hypothetical protein